MKRYRPGDRMPDQWVDDASIDLRGLELVHLELLIIAQRMKTGDPGQGFVLPNETYVYAKFTFLPAKGEEFAEDTELFTFTAEKYEIGRVAAHRQNVRQFLVDQLRAAMVLIAGDGDRPGFGGRYDHWWFEQGLAKMPTADVAAWPDLRHGWPRLYECETKSRELETDHTRAVTRELKRPGAKVAMKVTQTIVRKHQPRYSVPVGDPADIWPKS